jgi:putative membrane fusion protein
MTPQRRARVEDHSIEEGARKFYTRAMAIAIVLVLAASIIAMVRPYLVGRFAASAVVTTGSLDVAFSGKALVIRNERVGITPTSGTLHIVAANGDRVGAGDVVAQVLDPAAAARLTKSAVSSDKTLSDAIADASLREERERTKLSGIKLQLQMKTQERQLYIDRQDTKAANSIAAEISQLETAARLAEENIAAIRAEIAEAQRTIAAGNALGAGSGGAAVLRSRQAALISYHVDGLELALDPKDPSIMDVDPGQLQPEPRTLTEGESLNAGQAVFREITDLYTELLFFASTGDEQIKPGQMVKVRFPRLAQEAVSARVVAAKPRPDLGQGLQVVRVTLERFANSLADLRLEQASMITRTISGLVVPVSAIARRGDVTGLYVLRANRYVFREVTVVGTVGDRAVVTGVREGDQVLARP